MAKNRHKFKKNEVVVDSRNNFYKINGIYSFGEIAYKAYSLTNLTTGKGPYNVPLEDAHKRYRKLTPTEKVLYG